MERNKAPGEAIKPEGGSWTAEQLQAINSRGENVLVSAGAGSGKTRVLVERVLRHIIDRDNPVDLDRLLVVTFTNAAAAEMKQRIGLALEKAVKENPRFPQLRRQLLLLNRAPISTLHSFCLEVIRNYYYLRDLNPSFRILEETEAELLRQEIIEEILDEYYEKQEAESPFYRLVELYSSPQGDRALQLLLLRLYAFSRSHLSPAAWLEEKAAAFRVGSAPALEQTPWVEELRGECALQLESIVGQLREALEICRRPGGPEPYEENLQKELEAAEALRKTSLSSWEELSVALESFTFKRLPPCRSDLFDSFWKEKAVKIREGCKKELERIKGEFFQRPLEEQVKELQTLAPLMDILVELVISFEERYRQVKEEKGVADFSDLEYYALQLLSRGDPSSGLLEPSEAALEYRDRFVEVLVDEYQDINPVQEAILKLVSRPEPGGNLFMVGDVKQSIYRFRLAEPELFLRRMREYSSEKILGKCIALTHNFRSRREILAGVNFLFSQLMDEKVGEINYDHTAWLKGGALYPSPPEEKENPFAVEALLISSSSSADAGEEEGEGEGEESFSGGDEEEEELEKAALEGRLIARRIRELLGDGGGEPFYVLDRRTNRQRPVTFRDIVILLRSARNWATPLLEELRRAGIPAYVELETGYFEAVEVQVMLSLLKIIDNPFQEIPLAAVLRSPLVGLRAEELALVRAAIPEGEFYAALQLWAYGSGAEEGCAGEHNRHAKLQEKLRHFLMNLQRWQDEARQGSLANLIWQIYSDTGYYDLVGGMPGGKQRQANLRALYDRARQYEATSFRGLFRFLRFIEKLKERGGDLGTARALGEQENVVRILTVHKSKGLEFPVVFVAGLARQFNLQDLRQDFLLHRKLGFGPKFIDAELRLVYPTIPWLALERRLRRETLAEEMRILYVALTRAQEKLILVAAVEDLFREVQRWELPARVKGTLLPTFYRVGAKTPLDWIGPALLRHSRAGILRAILPSGHFLPILEEKEPSFWKVQIITPRDLRSETFISSEERSRPKWWENVSRLKPVPLTTDWAEEVKERLFWRYPWRQAERHLAKVSVSELRKLLAAGLEGEDGGTASWLQSLPAVAVPPRFLDAERKMTPAERGTAYHTVMQHLKLEPPLEAHNIKEQLEGMVARGLLSAEEKAAVDPEAIAAFFQTPLGQQVLQASRVEREIAFSMALPAPEIYGEREAAEKALEGFIEEEKVLIQGVIDCLAWDKEGVRIIDYKTDRTAGIEVEALKNRYRQQLELYARAVEMIWKTKVRGKFLYFFDNREVLEV